MEIDRQHEHEGQSHERDNEGIAERDIEVAIRAGESNDDHFTTRVALRLFDSLSEAHARVITGIHATGPPRRQWVPGPPSLGLRPGTPATRREPWRPEGGRGELPERHASA